MIVTPPTSITVTGHERQVGSRDTVETMEYRTLGRSGCLVSTYALGTMTFGAESDEPTCHEMLDVFIEAGGTLVDTADVYTNGRSEQIIGSWLADRPADITDRLVLASKARFPMGTDGNDAGLSRRHLRRALEASLRRLDVDHLDLYQVHGWDPLTPLEESVAFLDEAVQAGTISYWGLSNYTGWQVVAAVDTARSAGLASPVTMQPQYNLLAREVEWEIVPACEHLGIGLLPWSPSVVAGSPASIAPTSGPRVRPGSARTPHAGWRPTPPGRRASRPGRCWTRWSASPRYVMCPSPRWRWRGCTTALR